MRNTLKKSEILRGKNSFQEVFEKGRRCERKFLRCFYIVTTVPANSSTPSVSVGFAVSRQFKRAVDRNRIKRIMRESYRTHKHILIDTCLTHNINVQAVLLYAPAGSPELPTLADTNALMEELLPSISLTPQV